MSLSPFTTCRANIGPASFTNKAGRAVLDFPEGKIRVPTLGIMADEDVLTQGQMKQSPKFIEEPGSWRYAHTSAVLRRMKCLRPC